MYASLRCLACGQTGPAVEHYECPSCAGELDVQYDLERIREDGAFRRCWTDVGPIASSFGPLLPLADSNHALSLGEGNTPLIRSRRLAARLGLADLYFKLESSNPTGSFKDRQVAIGMSKALEFGHPRFATVSSGNVGVAMAAYAARAGLDALVWVSAETPQAKRLQIQVYGANLFVLPSPMGGGPDAYFDAVQGLGRYGRTHGLVPMVSARSVNPYMVEGAKTIAYETRRSLGRMPDVVVLPVGGGGLAGGVHKGFQELAALFRGDTVPKLLGAQRTAYFAPIEDLDAPQYRSGYYRPLDGHWAWQAITGSGGSLYHVDDAVILTAQAVLAEDEGIFTEPHGAYVIAALLEAARAGVLDRDALTVCIISGHGLKDMDAARQISETRGHAAVKIPSLAQSPIVPTRW